MTIYPIVHRMKKPWILFFSLSLVLASIFFFFNVAIFDGKIEFDGPDGGFVMDAKLSLSYFIGIGIEPEDMVGVKDFYLTAQGIFMAFVFILGLPALLAYRMRLKN
ncbi:MAG: hypothetical protein A3D92_19810 [Bacteroidetes bacterium RIFCSPHIGHO2_02_FULL_44_7]|nr:MAG: hypothetical protein A3D92_19810 [Bacteroidetes bacterium RIFCSPHIGHO2_02_FULL_44_7]